MEHNSKTLAIVAPFLNEEENILQFLERVSSVAKNIVGYSVTCILVDDGSTDGWESKLNLIDISTIGLNIKIIKLSRNFGHQNALAAGYNVASDFDIVVSLDMDLQDPPEIILDLLKSYEVGNQVVLAKRKSRKERNLAKYFWASLYYKCFRLLTGLTIPEQVGDFRLMDKRIVNILNNLSEPNQFFRGLVPWTGYKFSIVEYDRDSRFAGLEKFNFRRSLSLGIDGVVSFSARPLKILSAFGLLGTLLTLLSGIVLIILTIFDIGSRVPGWASVVLISLFIISIQMLSFGLLGIYVSRIHDQTKGRPRYIVESEINFK